MHNFKIFRYNPEVSPSTYFDEFKISVKSTTSVLEGLLYIFQNIDPSLSWRHSCRSAVCGSCAMRINGEYRLACKTLVKNLKGRQVVIEPLGNLPILKDLVVDMNIFYQKYEQIKPYLVPKELLPGQKEFYQSPENRVDLERWLPCILCGACYSACTMCYWDADFPGPFAFLAASARWKDERDALGPERIRGLSLESFIYRCHTELACTAVCPKGLSPTEAINQLKREECKIGLKYLFQRNACKEKKEMAPVEPKVAGSLPPGMDRKNFLHRFLFLIAAIISGAVLGIFTLPLFQKEEDAQKNAWLPAGKIPKEPDKEPQEIIYHQQKLERGKLISYPKRAYLMKSSKGEIIALDPTCTHLGCLVYWDNSMRLFVCPCHGGAFDVEGNVRLGPPPEGLKKLDLKLDNGSIFLRQKDHSQEG